MGLILDLLVQTIGWFGFCIDGTSLVLRSWWGLAMIHFLAVLLGIQIGVEEQTLRMDLDGYDDDALRIRWNLVPLTG